ncbi:ParB N-terminal domain-containing protein [Kluyvera sp. STS39-E]|uniref:ParB N-terminal domain-containing protein n=1 Tax=Kluyvera sp. STS39-E TaxID=3234748 RepID=UPI0034C5E5C9
MKDISTHKSINDNNLIVQRYPVKDGSVWRDKSYPGLVLTLNEELTGKYGDKVFNASGISNPTAVMWEGVYYDLEGNIWAPIYPKEEGQESYKTTEEHVLISIADISYQHMGNIQEEKMESIRKSIGTGYLPPIKVIRIKDGKYEPMDGRNRIEASVEAGYTKIPAVIDDTIKPKDK